MKTSGRLYTPAAGRARSKDLPLYTVLEECAMPVAGARDIFYEGYLKCPGVPSVLGIIFARACVCSFRCAPHLSSK